jgi:hypothetical protein
MNWKNKQLLQHATINAPKHAPISRRNFLGSVASLGAAVGITVSVVHYRLEWSAPGRLDAACADTGRSSPN